MGTTIFGRVFRRSAQQLGASVFALALGAGLGTPGAAFAAPAFSPLAAPPPEVARIPPTPAPAGPAELPGLVEHLDFGSLVFHAVAAGQWLARFDSSRTYAAARLPQVPVVDREFDLPAGQRARVSLEKVVAEESGAAIAMPSTPPLSVWSAGGRWSFPDAPIGRYFPGSFVRSGTASGKVRVQIFPVQWDRQTGRVVTLRSADLRIEFLENAPSHDTAPGAVGESILVTTEAMAGAARAIAAFQLERSGVRTDIVTVEQIDQSTQPIDESDLPNGYKQRDLANGSVVPYDPIKKVGYQYDLARKIDRYLQDRMQDGSPLKYVTLLGDATMVPPSYYFSIASDYGTQFGVTDWCYGARSQCGDPRVAVGRLPFQSEGQVTQYLAKLRRWARYADTAPSELSLFAGKAFEGDVFVGELGSLGILSSESDDWVGAHKFFRTKQNYNKAAVMKMLSGEGDSAFVYYLDHGIGNQWMVERDYVTANDILHLDQAGSTVNPLIVAISCSNAAFDETLFKDVVFGGDRYGSVSIGVALLRSAAGSIAYWGAGRPSIGNPIYSVDSNGNLTLDGGNYQLQVMDTFYEKYREAKAGTLGGLTLAAVQAYVSGLGNDMTDPKNLWTYLNMVLLGDPTLRLPDRDRSERTFPIASASAAFSRRGPSGFPQFLFSGSSSLDVHIQAPAAISETVLKLSPSGYAPLDQIVDQHQWPAGDGSFTVAPPASPETASRPTRYFARLENAEGVPLERQVWFETVPQSPAVPGTGALAGFPAGGAVFTAEW